MGLECAIELTDLCDDGSDPDHKLFITKESGKGSGPKFREEAKTERLAKQMSEKCREILNILKEEV